MWTPLYPGGDCLDSLLLFWDSRVFLYRQEILLRSKVLFSSYKHLKQIFSSCCSYLKTAVSRVPPWPTGAHAPADRFHSGTGFDISHWHYQTAQRACPAGSSCPGSPLGRGTHRVCRGSWNPIPVPRCLFNLLDPPKQPAGSAVTPRGSPKSRVRMNPCQNSGAHQGEDSRLISHCPAAPPPAKFCHPHLEMPQPAAIPCHLISKEDGPAGREDTYHHNTSLYLGSLCINPHPTQKLGGKHKGTGEPSHQHKPRGFKLIPPSKDCSASRYNKWPNDPKGE